MDPFTLQMSETLIDVIPPRITQKNSLLLDLPIEIQIKIIEIVQDDWLELSRLAGKQPHPLHRLRLTCKRLEVLCNPLLADSIWISGELERPKLELRNELAPKFAKYLKRMVFLFDCLQGEKELFMESVLTTILEGAVHLREIFMCHRSIDTEDRSQLLSAISKLSALQEMKIMESERPIYSPPYSTVQLTFHHRFLNTILDYHSQRLHVLAISSRTPMHESTFLKLRDTTSQLRYLTLSQVLTTETRDAFTDPRIWACAGRLESLDIQRCAISPATITRHVGAGVFGPLSTLCIIKCRDDSGDPPEPATANWTIPPLNSVQLDAFNDQEMDSLRTIQAKKVYIRRVWSSRPLCIEAFRESTTFPEVAKLHVEEDWDDEDFEELMWVCAMRGLTEVERDLPDYEDEDEDED